MSFLLLTLQVISKNFILEYENIFKSIDVDRDGVLNAEEIFKSTFNLKSSNAFTRIQKHD